MSSVWIKKLALVMSGLIMSGCSAPTEAIPTISQDVDDSSSDALVEAPAEVVEEVYKVLLQELSVRDVDTESTVFIHEEIAKPLSLGVSRLYLASLKYGNYTGNTMSSEQLQSAYDNIAEFSEVKEFENPTEIIKFMGTEALNSDGSSIGTIMNWYNANLTNDNNITNVLELIKTDLSDIDFDDSNLVELGLPETYVEGLLESSNKDYHNIYKYYEDNLIYRRFGLSGKEPVAEIGLLDSETSISDNYVFEGYYNEDEVYVIPTGRSAIVAPKDDYHMSIINSIEDGVLSVQQVREFLFSEVEGKEVPVAKVAYIPRVDSRVNVATLEEVDVLEVIMTDIESVNGAFEIKKADNTSYISYGDSKSHIANKDDADRTGKLIFNNTMISEQAVIGVNSETGKVYLTLDNTSAKANTGSLFDVNYFKDGYKKAYNKCMNILLEDILTKMEFSTEDKDLVSSYKAELDTNDAFGHSSMFGATEGAYVNYESANKNADIIKNVLNDLSVGTIDDVTAKEVISKSGLYNKDLDSLIEKTAILGKLLAGNVTISAEVLESLGLYVRITNVSEESPETIIYLSTRDDSQGIDFAFETTVGGMSSEQFSELELTQTDVISAVKAPTMTADNKQAVKEEKKRMETISVEQLEQAKQYTEENKFPTVSQEDLNDISKYAYGHHIMPTEEEKKAAEEASGYKPPESAVGKTEEEALAGNKELQKGKEILEGASDIYGDVKWNSDKGGWDFSSDTYGVSGTVLSYGLTIMK